MSEKNLICLSFKLNMNKRGEWKGLLDNRTMSVEVFVLIKARFIKPQVTESAAEMFSWVQTKPHESQNELMFCRCHPVTEFLQHPTNNVQGTLWFCTNLYITCCQSNNTWRKLKTFYWLNCVVVFEYPAVPTSVQLILTDCQALWAPPDHTAADGYTWAGSGCAWSDWIQPHLWSAQLFWVVFGITVRSMTQFGSTFPFS